MTGPHARAHWHDAYDAQMALWRWYRTSPGQAWMAESCRANMQPRYLSAATRELIVRLYDAEMGRLLDCDPIFVSESMCEIVDHARQSFQPEPLMETDLLTPRGFLWFATPMHMADRYGVDIALQAASWSWEYQAKDDETAMRVLAEVTTDGRWAAYGSRIKPWEMQEYIDAGDIWPAGVSVTLYAERDAYATVGEEKGSTHEAFRRMTASVPVVPFHITPWHFGQTFDGNEVDERGDVTGPEGWWTTLQTAFRMMQAKIAHTPVERASRDHRRTAKKHGLPEPHVVVVRLRREEPDREHRDVPEHERRKLTHRFIRSGHWRNQPYPSLGEGVTRQIWIDPTVVGDPSLPLIVRPRRVYQWSR